MKGPWVVGDHTSVGGLSFAKRELGFRDFAIHEKGNDVGGVWRANTYPGCSFDVEIHWYSLSSDLNANWNQSHGLQPEIQEYWIGLATKYGLYHHLVFNTRLLSAEWDDIHNHYKIVVEDVNTGRKTADIAQIVISAVGILEIPKVPCEIPGVEKFKGTWFHSATWPRALDACSCRFVPCLAADPSVQVFIRTPVWFNTRPHIPYSDTAKWLFAKIPLVMRLHRAYIMFKFDWPSLKPQSTASRER